MAICLPCREQDHSTCEGGTKCVCQHKPELGEASRRANELLVLASENAKLVEACEHKADHTKMQSCKSCPYGRGT